MTKLSFIVLLVLECVDSASFTITYSVIDGDESSMALMTDSGMTSDCGSSASRNITVQLQRLPTNKRYTYNNIISYY